jgi:hypothetical protein
MSEADPEAEEAAEDETEEETETEPTFYEKVQAVIDEGRITELREADPEELSDVEQEALEVKDLENDYSTNIDELDDSQETHDELDRLYNDENLSLIDIGRLFRTTDATVQRRMEQHELPRRGSRNEISKERLVEAYFDLAYEMNQADSPEELAELVESGDAHMPTTTEMGEQGAHSAHTYYNYFDGWDAVKQAAYDELGAKPPADDEADDEEDEEDDEEDASKRARFFGRLYSATARCTKCNGVPAQRVRWRNRRITRDQAARARQHPADL